MIYAQVKSGVVVNTILIQDESLEGVFLQGYDYCINITSVIPKPDIGWSYDGENFTAPVNQITLDEYKAAQIAAVDLKTTMLIGQGFVFDSVAFSLSIVLNCLTLPN